MPAKAPTANIVIGTWNLRAFADLTEDWETPAGAQPRLHGRRQLDFVPELRGGRTLNQLSWHISDHYPLWAEFAIPRP